ncbi:MAG: glycosyltransferase family 39 protein [Candidatus Omnitrophica bacterium]|nr:glycosyltransferase family 39 protein [Candidatus Omnitrophota bacterium]
MIKKHLILGLIILEVVAVLVALIFAKECPFKPDSSLYIEMARQVRAGEGLVCAPFGINPVCVDTVPCDTFPPGYPLLIYSLSLTGMSENDAAVVIPAACFVLLPIVFFLVLRYLVDDINAFFSSLMATFLFPNIHFSSQALSDIPFLLTVLTSFLFLFKSIQEEKRKYIILAGLMAGFAILIRYVGYALFPSVVMGIIIALSFGLLSFRFSFKMLFYYSLGFSISFIPYMLRNIFVFHAITPYYMHPSDVSFLDNVRYYFNALLESFGVPHAEIVIAVIIFLIFANLIHLIASKQSKFLSSNSSKRASCIIITILYLLMGSCLVILARTKYNLGKAISVRYLMQYNWIYLTCVTSIMLCFFRKSAKMLKFKISPLLLKVIVACLLLSFFILQFAKLTEYAAYHDIEELGFANAKKMAQRLASLPNDMYIISNKAHILRIFAKRRVRFLEGVSVKTFEAELLGRRDFALVLVNEPSSNFSQFLLSMRQSLPKKYREIFRGEEGAIFIFPMVNFQKT